MGSIEVSEPKSVIRRLRYIAETDSMEDLTDRPDDWSETDFVSLRVMISASEFDELKESANLMRSDVRAVASLVLGLHAPMAAFEAVTAARHGRRDAHTQGVIEGQ